MDRTNTTGSVWLGLTIGCAQCHTHKYDPITQREYYQLFAFFNTISEVDIEAPLPAERQAPKKPPTLAQTLSEHTPRRVTRVLRRGDFLRPGARVDADTPAVLPPIESRGTVPDRLDLARWLIGPENPLTPRVAANRIWRHLFGRGIVRSPEDFGTRGDRPSHPELLDWLALESMRQGWSLKRMVRMIVTSSAYRQRSASRPDLLRIDAENHLLARQNRFRLEAEVVRDVFLASSGLMTRVIGGPSVRPPLPPGVRELGYAGSIKWPVSTGPDRYRRGLYVFFQRTVPYPMLTAFDAPDSNVTCVRRRRSNTPLQALTLLNDPVFHEGAKALGQRVVHETAGNDVAARVRHLFLLAVSRDPDPREQAKLEALYRDLRAEYRKHPEEAARMTQGLTARPEVGARAVEMAAWIAVSRVVLNLDEVVTRN